MTIDIKNESSPAYLLAVAEWNPSERIGRERSRLRLNIHQPRAAVTSPPLRPHSRKWFITE